MDDTIHIYSEEAIKNFTKSVFSSVKKGVNKWDEENECEEVIKFTEEEEEFEEVNRNSDRRNRRCDIAGGREEDKKGDEVSWCKGGGRREKLKEKKKSYMGYQMINNTVRMDEGAGE